MRGRTFLLGVQELENRECLSAGLGIDVSLGNGSLRIVGNDTPNTVDIRPMGSAANADLVVRELQGSQWVEVHRSNMKAVQSIQMDMGGGRDSVTIRGTSSIPVKTGTIQIGMGKGVDQVAIENVMASGTVSIAMGSQRANNSDPESAQVSNSSIVDLVLSSSNSVGTTSYSMNNLAVDRTLKINGSAASDFVSISGGSFGSIDANLGDEPKGSGSLDQFRMNENRTGKTTVKSLLNINFGYGIGNGSLRNVDGADLTVQFRDADKDVLDINKSKFRHATLRGGAGANDEIKGSDNTFASRDLDLRGFEVRLGNFRRT